MKWSLLIIFMEGVLLFSLADLAMGDEAKKWPNGRIVLVNHRGLSPGYPENTLAAFKNSVAMGVEVIELDLRGTKDGIPVVMHDKTVDRTTNGEGWVEDFTLSEMKKLDAGSYIGRKFVGERVPTYQETLEVVSGTGVKLLLDIKLSSSLDYHSVVKLTERYKAVLNVIIGARTVTDVRLFRSLNPNIRILGFIKSPNDIEHFVKAGADIIRLWPSWIHADPGLVDKVHKLGKPVWTTANVTPREGLLELIKVGVNGILTDLPDVLTRLTRDIEERKVRP
ncbi:MAG: glycerophosphodiester phosphodiesterase [Candidatus Binatia bacterium]